MKEGRFIYVPPIYGTSPPIWAPSLIYIDLESNLKEKSHVGKLEATTLSCMGSTTQFIYNESKAS